MQAGTTDASTSTATHCTGFAKVAYTATAFHDAVSLVRSLPVKRKRRAPSTTSTGQFGRGRPFDAEGSEPSGAGGYTSQADIHALLPHPLEDNSAMDGYAVAASAIAHASPAAPVLLPVLGRIVAGDAPPVCSDAASTGCWEIMTGAVFPSPGFDSVVKVEDASRTESLDARRRHMIAFSAPIHPGKNRRRRGEQFESGDVLLRVDEEVTPEAVMLLAAGGVQHGLPGREVQAHRSSRRGRVAILATGKEVVSLSDREQSLAPGQVVDCITPFLDTFLRSRDYEPVHLPPCGDSLADLSSALSTALATESFDLILTVAGVSLGSADHTPEALASIGLTQQFHGVAIRPGGPVMLSLHEATGTPVLSLPGNPIASAVCMRAFGEEVLRRLEDDEEDGREPEEWRPLDMKGANEQDGGWSAWLDRQKAGVSTFAAVPVGARGTPVAPNSVLGSTCGGPCALRSLIGAGAWVRADGARDGTPCRAYWRRF